MKGDKYMDINKKDMFEALTLDFAKAVMEYRKAGDESEIEINLFPTDAEEEEKFNEYEERMNSLTASKDYINITREEYWQQIIKSKIEVIACIGGLEMMQEFSTYLYNHALDDKLKLYNAFDYYADGIGGWCK